MKDTSLKVTAASILLSATVLGTPLIGDAHGKDDGRGDGHKDGKRSHQMMDRKHDRKENRQGQKYRGYENINWDKKENRNFKDNNKAHVKSKETRNRTENAQNQVNNVQNKPENVQNKAKNVQNKPKKIQNKVNKVQNSREKVKNEPKVPLITYAQADAYGKNSILPLIAGTETAKANLDWNTLAKNYRLLSNELKKGTKTFTKVDGKENRDKLIATYNAPAKEKLTALALPISIYSGIGHIEAQLEAGHTGKVMIKLEKLKLLAAKLSNAENDALQKDLITKVKNLESKINAIKAQKRYEAVSL